MKRAQQFWQANRKKLTFAVRTSAAALAVITVAFIRPMASQTQVNPASNGSLSIPSVFAKSLA